MKRLFAIFALLLALALPVRGWGAFPIVAATNTSVRETTGTSHTVNLPAGITSGDLLIVFFGAGNGVTVTWPGGWTEFTSGTVAGSVQQNAAYRRADGTEGASITVTTSAARRSVHASYRITGHHATSNPEGASATGTSANPDPPNLAPSWGTAEDVLWIVSETHSTSDAITAYPTNYGNTLEIATSVSALRLGSARRELNASSENPGTYTIANSRDWVAGTAAVRPAAGGAPACPKTLALMGAGC